MVRATVPTDGEKADPTKWPTDINTDYMSQTETTEQAMAGDLRFASGKKPIYDGSPGEVAGGEASGTSPNE